MGTQMQSGGVASGGVAISNAEDKVSEQSLGPSCWLQASKATKHGQSQLMWVHALKRSINRLHFGNPLRAKPDHIESATCLRIWCKHEQYKNKLAEQLA